MVDSAEKGTLERASSHPLKIFFPKTSRKGSVKEGKGTESNSMTGKSSSNQESLVTLLRTKTTSSGPSAIITFPKFLTRDTTVAKIKSKGKKRAHDGRRVRFDSSLDRVHEQERVPFEQKHDVYYSCPEMIQLKRRQKHLARMEIERPHILKNLKNLYTDEDHHDELTSSSLGPEVLSTLSAKDIRGLEPHMMPEILAHRKWFIKNFICVQNHYAPSRRHEYMCSSQESDFDFDALTKNFSDLSTTTSASNNDSESSKKKRKAALEKLLCELSIQMSAVSSRFAREMALLDEYEASLLSKEEPTKKNSNDFSDDDTVATGSDESENFDI